MVSLLSEIHFWTAQEDVIIKQNDYGSFKYYPKKETQDNLCMQSKKQFCELRGLIWTPPNKRPHKLKDKLKELEDHLVHNKIVCFTWESDKLLLLLSTGLIVTITINYQNGDIINIVFDKQLAAKLQVNILCGGTIFNNQVICICNDGHLLGYGGMWKDGWVLEGGPRRNLHYHGDWLAVWGKATAEHPQPWFPLAKDHQRANLHLYWIGNRDPELLAYKKTDGEPLQVVVSSSSSKHLIVIEQKVTQRGAVSVEVSNFELINNNLKRVSVTSVPLQTQVSCSVLNDSEERLLIGCIDGSVALLDRTRGSTRTVKAAFIPTLAAWHKEGNVVAISNERGQIQYFDTALNCIKTQIIGEDCTPTALIDLSGYFNAQFSVASINWGPKDLILSLEQGPLVYVTHIERSLSFKSLIQRYLLNGKVSEAISLLLSRQFDGKVFEGLQLICSYLMKLKMTEEVANQLQNALGCFHNSPVPLGHNIKHKFGNQVYMLSRRFFHQLVRAKMFETAFLLAVDLGHHDLFMDLYYIAVKIGETEMAAAARAQASSLLSRCSSEASNCSRSSCSQCSETGSSEESDEYAEEEEETKIPTESPSQNHLLTNFNQPNPTTYKPLLESIAQSKSISSYTPRATFVRAPQVPQNFVPKSPFTPPLPNLSLISSNTLGIPYGRPSTNSKLSGQSTVSSYARSSSSYESGDLYAAFSSNNLTVNNIKNSFSPIKQVVSPPLPVTSGSACGKKPQAKVKFSDTVTAFIVPEIKRPVRPAPPPHVTDPQKELADSLPLCHPNEDYLKDFAPVQKEDDGSRHAKIKVVHFGVV